ncbi:DUF1287 domain-containing protein [Thiolinea disciformis]|uniref:DUF1287 domain-containing protein n=1 Tax=Thiolinea disciformis TaxID=125614 RepID=UPI0003730C20|nr:DUF1287 domain-containing protein [Thiolinea disciformis]
MDKPEKRMKLIKKINACMMIGLFGIAAGLAGCSTAPVKEDAVDTASTQELETEDTATDTKKIAQAQRLVVAPKKTGKDKHHLEFEAKKRWYQDQWEQQQRQNASRQRSLPHYAMRSDDANRYAAQNRYNQANRNYAQARVDYSAYLSRAALDRLRYRVRYDGSYIPIGYPNGDVPQNIGVCTDTVIRSYRRLGVDLQRLVHQDMIQAFYSYPNLPKWGLQGPDTNIDHRRVHNLKVFFTRHGQRLPVTRNASDYRPGDLVTWSLGGDQEHIGIVVDRPSPADPNRFMIVHNIGDGEKLEDVLFKMPITGHYRFYPNVRPQAQLASARF